MNAQPLGAWASRPRPVADYMLTYAALKDKCY